MVHREGGTAIHRRPLLIKEFRTIILIAIVAAEALKFSARSGVTRIRGTGRKRIEFELPGPIVTLTGHPTCIALLNLVTNLKIDF